MRLLIIYIICFFSCAINAQTFSIKGKVTDINGKQKIPYATIKLDSTNSYATTDINGAYELQNIKPGKYAVLIYAFGYKKLSGQITVSNKDVKKDFQLIINTVNIDSITISAKQKTFGITRLNDVEGTSIYAGKKSEVIVMDDITANKATNNSRQIYAKIAGLNIWESDVAGIQLGIGGRGLNPQRTTNFNTRQNGYDMSADALGYPESYYSPPAEAIDRIEIVRGAASLQYGTQFGGLVNFKLKEPPTDKKIQFVSRETYGSWNFKNTFNSLGGTVKKVSYYVYYQRKTGNGWRPNSQFKTNTAYASLIYKATEKLSFTFQYTYMNYLAHQPGGLTDAEFEQNPMQSIRSRNWFAVNWNMAAMFIDYKINKHLKINSRFFGLFANRSALGILTYINRSDPGTDRQLWTDNYTNFGNETRLLCDYNLFKKSSTLVIGTRYYHGNTARQQGYGNDGTTGYKSDFAFNSKDQLQYSNYTFPEYNFSLFAENIFRISSKFNIIPGVRYENIKTTAAGYYNIVNTDLAGNVVYHQLVNETKNRFRSFAIGGIGFSFNQSSKLQTYANISQNYRAINFSDMRITNPNLKVDPNLQDEKGYSADIGIRGNLSGIFNYDVSVFMLHYNNRIGTIQRVDTVTYNIYNYRTNVSASRNLGIESFAELDVWKLIRKESARMKLSIFTNISYIDARYIGSKEPAFQNKKVEFAPNLILKTGLGFRKKKFAASFQYAYTSYQFSDATNAPFTANAIDGIVPAYFVLDLSAEYTINKIFSVYGSVNNLTNNMYFTRRADSYPGPGIIPADARSFYITLQVKL